MLRAEVGDQLVAPGATLLHGEVVGVIIHVHGDDGGPPFTVRWYDSGHATTVNPDPERHWIRPARQPHEVGRAMRGMRDAA